MREDTELRAAKHIAARAAVKPTGKTYRGGPSMLGDGEMCPVDGHGRMIVGGSGRQFCPHQEYDKERVKKDG